MQGSNALPSEAPADVSLARKLARRISPLVRVRRALWELSRKDALIMALYQKVFERGRLTLPSIAAEKLIANDISVELPVLHPLSAGEDTPLFDLLFLLALARSRKARRILEVGTYRARTTLSLHLNCPDAEIISYDIEALASAYRTKLEATSVQLRNASFRESAATLMAEEPFDFIFIDGGHDIESVCKDSELAFKILTGDGIVIWHDYRYNGYLTSELRVPEALGLMQEDRRFFHVLHTTCAVYCLMLAALP